MQNYLSERWLFWVFYPLISIAVNLIGIDYPFAVLIRKPSFFSDLLLAFTLSFSIGFYLTWIWKIPGLKLADRASKYLISKIGLGLIVPFFFGFFLELVYLKYLLKIPLEKSPLYYLDGPMIFIFIFIANLYYIGRYVMVKQRLILDKKVKELELLNKAEKPSFFMIQQANKQVKIELQHILYVLFENEIVSIYLRDGRKITSVTTLKSISEKLPIYDFFQINRQLIISKPALHSYQLATGRKLKIQLIDRTDDSFILPKTKVKEFKTWLND